MMRAAVVSVPGGPEVLRIEDRPIPAERPGWILVRVRAFGLNRSELLTRAGESGAAVRFPRVLGIECAGEVCGASDSGLEPGQPVIAAMGGMGRDFDGGYAEFALLPATSVIPVQTRLSWPELGAVPEAFGTAWGSLDTLELQTGETLLVRGATSSVGMAAITLAKARGLHVIATTRQAVKAATLEACGADRVVIDDGAIGAAVRTLGIGGADALLELVGPTTIIDSFAGLRLAGRACLTGYLEGSWDDAAARRAAAEGDITFARFSSEVIARDNYAGIFAEIVAGIESGRYRANLDRTFALDDIADAHRYMESNRAVGKVVGLTFGVPLSAWHRQRLATRQRTPPA
jgi:NADPH:quinone reductase-like Zn-dependent oxidoreductase